LSPTFSLKRSLVNASLVIVVHVALLELLVGRNLVAVLLSYDGRQALLWVALAALLVLARFIALVCLPGFLLRCAWLALARRWSQDRAGRAASGTSPEGAENLL